MLALAQQRGSHVPLRLFGRNVRSFVPGPLAPNLRLSPATEQALAAATDGLAQLNPLLAAVPSLDWLFYAAVRREAVIWKQMECANTGPSTDLVSFSDVGALVTAEVDCLKPAELCYPLNALAHARQAMQTRNCSPVDPDLLLELHRHLTMGTREQEARGGLWRAGPIWLGNLEPDKATHVPPPFVHILPLMQELQEYIDGDDGLPKLVRIGLVHGQFGLIHPFKNANGRVASAVDLLLLQYWGFLRHPVLHLNLFLRREREPYYYRMSRLQYGEWDAWLNFFLTGIQRAAVETQANVRRIQHTLGSDLRRLINAAAPPNVLKVFCALMRRPAIPLARLVGLMQMTIGEINDTLTVLRAHGIVREVRGLSNDGVAVVYDRYLQALDIPSPAMAPSVQAPASVHAVNTPEARVPLETQVTEPATQVMLAHPVMSQVDSEQTSA